ncbi:transmembrane emp24 domain-containing protein 10 isoform X3 [Phycodurus eques]|uniref:transmembrane emp24 domain-containing protein 10 isoform X3 n=1 Tax=Phycodurus eques TaxID=693459 RepID=UPI002ACF073D|nr:transmembrane emp24 domain-containing protein 10 isoform X3 [Phycodurus eques]
MSSSSDLLAPLQPAANRLLSPRPKQEAVKRSWHRLVGCSVCEVFPAMARLAALLLLPVLIESASSISFSLPVNSRKCLREEIHKDVLVTGEYEISEPTNTKTNLKITDSAGHLLYTKDDAAKGKFAFTTEDYDMFEVCFESKSPMGTGRVPDQLVHLDMKHGVEAKNYEEIAKVEKLKPLEVELRRLEDLSESIVNDFAYMKKREEEMRDTNESTNTRVLYFSIFSMCCLIGLATWQVFYLRRFFKAKKLIE